MILKFTCAETGRCIEVESEDVLFYKETCPWIHEHEGTALIMKPKLNEIIVREKQDLVAKRFGDC